MKNKKTHAVGCLILIAFFCLLSYRAEASLNDSLVGWWRFDENSGSQAIDASGSGHTASLINAPNWVAGKYGSAVELNGTNQGVNTGLTYNFNQFTFSGWFYPTASVGTITLADNLTFVAGYGGINLRSDRLYLLDGQGTTLLMSFLRPTNWLNNWHQYVVTYDGVTASIFIDGVLIKSQNGSLSALTTKQSLVLGRISVSPQNFFAGNIDDVRLYNRALSNQEVTELYAYIPDGIMAISSVQISSPTQGANISGDVTLTASINGGGSAKSVQFLLDGTPIGKKISGQSYSTIWHSVSASNGSHLLTVLASDEAGIGQTSPAVNVNVNNAIPDPYFPKTSSNEFFVSTSGSAAGDGSSNNPWDLNTALHHPPSVQAGDTIWVRGGTYTGGFTSSLTGSVSAPITVRNYRDERATIDNPSLGAVTGLTVNGQYTWFWGLEVTCSNPQRISLESGSNPSSRRGTGIIVGASDIKLINMIVHDFGDGINLGQNAARVDVVGGLLYFNGWQGPDRGHGHGIYGQNNTNSVKNIKDTVSFYNFATGMKAYGEGAHADNFAFDGVTLLNNGAIDSVKGIENFTLGTITYPVQNVSVENSQFYIDSSLAGTVNVMLGYSNPSSTNILFRNNYVVAPVYPISTYGLSSAELSNNTVFLTSNSQVGWRAAMIRNTWSNAGYSGLSINNNKYFYNENTAPFFQPSLIFNIPAYTGSIVGEYANFSNWQNFGFDRSSTYSTNTLPQDSIQYRANGYEPRVTVTIWNWSKSDTVNINGLSAGLSIGDNYEIVDAENYFAGPVVTGKYNGGQITIPMSNLAIMGPVGNVPIPPTHTSPVVGVFYIRKTANLKNVTNNLSGSTDKTRPTMPQNFVSESITGAQVALKWNASSDNVGVSGYKIYRDGMPIATTNQTKYVDNTVSPGKQYMYFISSYDSANNYSGTFEAVQVTTPSSNSSSASSTENGSGSNQNPSSYNYGGGSSAVGNTNSTYVGSRDNSTASFITSSSTAQVFGASSTLPYAKNKYRFTRALRLGMSGTDVRQLQIFLNTHGFILASSGYGSPGNETNYFGPATFRALVKLQNTYAKFILTPLGLTKATGYFGPSTIVYVNSK